MTLTQKYYADQYHPTAHGFISIFEFSDFEVHRMDLFLKKSCPKEFQAILVIQVDIGGHPPFPIGSKKNSGNFGNLLFSVVFRVLNFQSHFEALNEGKWGEKWKFLRCFSHKNYIPRIDISNEVSSAPNADRMQKLPHGKLTYQLPPLWPTNLLDFHLSGLGFGFSYGKKDLIASL
jgi:hypothetical protein